MTFTIIVPMKKAIDIFVEISHIVARLEDNLMKSTQLYKDYLHFFQIFDEEIEKAQNEKRDCEFKFDICEVIESHIFAPKGWKFVDVRDRQVLRAKP